jgi:hypothetical protein
VTSVGTAGVLGGQELPADAAAQAVNRILSPDWVRFTDQQAACGYCAHPVRLRGGATTLDATTGEVLSSYDTATEPDGVTYVRCGNRRAAICPSCSREYKGDMWHLLAAGAGGGMKGVPTSVGFHPQLFVTLTAPSFGPVHTTRSGKQPCHSHRRGRLWLCSHGRPSWCGHRHSEEDARLGEPLCSDCYDYSGHVVWQWNAPELWRRFTIALRRDLAAHLNVPRGRLGEHAQVSFAKVAEFQRRGIVHFHAIIRLDGPATATEAYPAPTVAVDANALAELVRAAAAKVAVEAAPTFPADQVRRLRFGAQLDVRPVRASVVDDESELSPQAVAAYIAKYATKACEDFGVPPGITGPGIAQRLGVRAHPVRIIATAARIAAEGGGPYDGLGRWLHMLGFRGHFATKSRRYSVTLGRLRTARRRWRTAQLHKQRRGIGPVVEAGHVEDPGDDESTLVVGSWAFAGIGWRTAGDAALAAESAALAREYADGKRYARAASSPLPSSR